MVHQLGLGAAVGVAVGLMSWRGNQTPHVISVFPDGITFLVLVVLLSLAVWFEQRRRSQNERVASLRGGLTIASAAGVVFGSAVILLGVQRLTNPSLVLSAFGFLTALGSSLPCGAVATLLLSRSRLTREH